MSVALKATVTVDFGTGRSRTDITTVEALMHEAIHALIQVHGTVEAKRLVLERFERYDENYPGLAAVRRAAKQGGASAVADVHAKV